MIGVDLASSILDFGARMKMSPQRAEEQLNGAVALHNLLMKHRIAYLADEVGMGKTLVALGAVALFRHFDPRFRVLFISPRKNIQQKWAKELRNFAGSNVTIADLRVRGLGGQPARPLVHCETLVSLLREAALDPDRDFFARMTSFSLAIGRDDEAWNGIRRQVREQVPWLSAEALDGRNKDNLARGMCCALPTFDLVVVDEAHNLKHGFKDNVAARNRVLALALGHPRGGADRRLYPTYGPRARRVLFLSATPIEDDYKQLWNQLDVLGCGDTFDELRSDELDDEEKKVVASRFLIRRVTSLRVAGEEMTKNQYRREWRRGGVMAHDEPMRIDDVRQRLTVALVQKKVTELLGSTKFNNRFQIGMLASFESFAQTAKLPTRKDEASNFDDAEQTEDAEEREGVDVRDINALAESHFETFKTRMSHPKMDALVASLGNAWRTGEKALVFVRRVASVKELKQKLDESYDAWLISHLLDALPSAARPELERQVRRYQRDKLAGNDKATFFAWFFRGTPPDGVTSGATIAERFNNKGAVLSTFFEENHVAALLDARPGDVGGSLARALGCDIAWLRTELQRRAGPLLSGTGPVRRGQRFEAAQAAAIELLHDSPGPLQDAARAVWAERFHHTARGRRSAPDNIADALEWPTFFTELRQRPALRLALWPEPTATELRARLREQELRATLLASAVRLGHQLIDLYVMLMGRVGTLAPRAVEDGDEGESTDLAQILAFLDLLESQRHEPRWSAYRELSELAAHFELIVDLNLHEVRNRPLHEVKGRVSNQLLGDQQPVGGMFEEVSQTLVRQFRMPGYPLVLVTTDLLQEGEDLHAFCSSVHHYGISWTPSAMEQRTGRIDRVRSQSERRLTSRHEAPAGEALLQVYFPHLEDTVELLQVRKVLTRMNTFLRLMHEGLHAPSDGDRRLDLGREMLGGEAALERIESRLVSAFPIPEKLLAGTRRKLATSSDTAARALARFARLHGAAAPDLPIDWEPIRAGDPPEVLLGTARLDAHVQPLGLYLRIHHGRLLVRCISPVGRVEPAANRDAIRYLARDTGARIGAVEGDGTYDLTVEEDVLLNHPDHDLARVTALIGRVVRSADELEHTLLGEDQALDIFAADLRGEHGGRHD